MRRWLTIVAIGLSPLLLGGPGPSALAAGTMSLKAVKKNGVAISGGPVNTVQAAPNDVIEVEIKTCGWANDIPGQTQIKAIEARIGMRAGATSSGCGTAIPTGWDRPLDPITCTSPANCPAEFPSCVAGGDPTTCEGPDHDPSGLVCNPPTQPPPCNAYVDGNRADAVFQPQPAIHDRSVAALDYAFGGVSLGAPVPDPGCNNPRYLGTFSLRLSSDACGTFTFDLVPGDHLGPLSYFQFANNEVRAISVHEPLTIHLLPPGDLNQDSSIDLADFVLLQLAFLPNEPDCPTCDLDDDGDTDLADFGVFQTSFTGAD